MMTDPPTVAAIDCGSHATKILISRDGEELAREGEPTWLTEGLAASGSLQPEPLDRVYATLRRYRGLIDHHGVDHIRVVATSAARSAANGEEFLARVGEIIGAPAELIAGEAEAALAFLGATSDLHPELGPFLVFDIGDGSTEFAYGSTGVEAAISLDIGGVGLSEEYLESDPPRPEELSACVTIAGAWLDDVDREMPQVHGARTVIGVAGTVSTAVRVEIGLDEDDRDRMHHFCLTREAAEDVFRTLATENRIDRAANPGLPPDQVDTIVGGMSILVKIMRHFDLPSILASESDILDGLTRSLR